MSKNFLTWFPILLQNYNMDRPPDIILCPPDRLVPMDYLTLRNILQQEISRSVDSASLLPDYQRMLSVLENITHMQYLHNARQIKSAMLQLQPLLTSEQLADLGTLKHSPDAAATTSLEDTAQDLLDSMMHLLLEARYSPLTALQWDVVKSHEYTFDIPVEVCWDVLDDQMLSRFWQRNKAVSADSDAKCSSSTNGGSSGTSDGPKQPKRQQPQLPQFKDRIMVFHRGVGVSTAEGLYLDKKIDLLLGYLITDPITRMLEYVSGWMSNLVPMKGSSQGISSSNREPSEQTQSQSALVSSSRTWRDHDDPQPFSSSDLSHRYVRYVIRRTLRNIMPGPREVLQHFGKVLTLQEPTLKKVVVIYRAANEQAAAGAAAGSSSTASLAVAESAVAAALYAAGGAAGAAMAADAVMEAVKTAATAKSASKEEDDGSSSGSSGSDSDSDSSSMDERPSNSSSATQQSSMSPSPAAARHFNRHNVVMKSFRNVALADLELVFPSKHVEVLPSTLVRSALTAVGAVVAAAAIIQQQSSDFHWSLPVFVSAAGVVAGRAIKVLSTVKSQQSALTGVMVQMQYNASEDSQESVAVRLIDELREQHLKEAALVITVMIMKQQQQRQQQVERQRKGRHIAASGSTAVVMSADEIDMACEEYLLQRLGLKVDIMLDDTLPRMVEWGVLQQHEHDCYTLLQMTDALENLEQFWYNTIHQQQQQQQRVHKQRLVNEYSLIASASTKRSSASTCSDAAVELSAVSAGRNGCTRQACAAGADVGTEKQQRWRGFQSLLSPSLPQQRLRLCSNGTKACIRFRHHRSSSCSARSRANRYHGINFQ